MVQDTLVDRLIGAIESKGTPVCVGLDPVWERIPEHIKQEAEGDVEEAISLFNMQIIDAVSILVPTAKLQIAFYEAYGLPGIRAFERTKAHAREQGLIVITDAKRNDIGSTAKAYAQGHLGNDRGALFDTDFLTVNPYLGSDGITPFADACLKNDRGIFVLVKTSNKSSGELQDRLVKLNGEEQSQLERLGVEVKDGHAPLYQLTALNIVRPHTLGSRGNRGYSPIGAVVGATYPEQAQVLRKIMSHSILLAPGYGTQGGSGKDVVPCFNDDGLGAVVNSSSGITYAYEKANDPRNFAKYSKEATQAAIKDIDGALRTARKIR